MFVFINHKTSQKYCTCNRKVACHVCMPEPHVADFSACQPWVFVYFLHFAHMLLFCICCIQKLQVDKWWHTGHCGVHLLCVRRIGGPIPFRRGLFVLSSVLATSERTHIFVDPELMMWEMNLFLFCLKRNRFPPNLEDDVGNAFPKCNACQTWTLAIVPHVANHLIAICSYCTTFCRASNNTFLLASLTACPRYTIPFLACITVAFPISGVHTQVRACLFSGVYKHEALSYSSWNIKFYLWPDNTNPLSAEPTNFHARYASRIFKHS